MQDVNELEGLAARLKAREAGAWERIYALTHLPLLRTLRRRLGDAGRAEEALQATFVTAIERIEAFDPAKGTADAWLAGIAWKKSLEMRRGPRLLNLEETPEAEEPAGPAMNGAGGEEEIVALALDNLEPRYAEVLRRKYLEDEPIEAIAAALQLKTTTVGTLLHRGREKFRKAYRKIQERMERRHGRA